MIITFNDWINKSFEIKKIQYEFDDNDMPIDIVIWADRQILEEIEYYCSIGSNIQELDELEQHKLGCTHEALYARLAPFTVSKATRVEYINI